MKIKNRKKNVLILGGAGFIGSNIAGKFYEEGFCVTVIDGLLPQTGGSILNLRPIIKRIRFIKSGVESLTNLNKIFSENGIIIDSMAWTAHNLAIQDPFYDLELNVRSHLYVLMNLPGSGRRKIIYLSSRSQYGNPLVKKITEDSPMIPVDIHGAHKLVAESYYRIYSGLKSVDVVSLRFPNCFGENQPVKGRDIGLVGSFIRDALKDRRIVIFSGARKRHLVYVEDLAEVVFLLSQKDFTGFKAFNLSGEELPIKGMAEMIVFTAGKGRVILKKLPAYMKYTDIKSISFSERKLRGFLGNIPRTEIRNALSNTVSYFKERMR